MRIFRIIAVCLILILLSWHVSIFKQWGHFIFNDKTFAKNSLKISVGLLYQRNLDVISNRINNFLHKSTYEGEEVADPYLPEEIRIYVDPAKQRELDSNLPVSGREYKDAKLTHDGKEYDIKIRYRGDKYYHWSFEKKSFKIKLEKKEKLFDHRILQLTNIKGPSLFNEYIGNKLANKMGILTIDEKYIKMYINDKYYGLYLYLEPYDEIFLKKNDKELGTIWSGDLAALEDSVIGLTTNIYDSPYVWNKKEEGKSNNDVYLEKLILSIKEVHKKGRFANFGELVDLDYYVKFLAWIDLVQTTHISRSHNNVLFFDNTTEKFTQIPWDNAAFWERYGLNIATNDFFRSFYKNPLFVQEKNELMYKYITQENITEFLKEHVTFMKNSMLEDIINDPYKTAQNLLRMPIPHPKGYNKVWNQLLRNIEKTNEFADILTESEVIFVQDADNIKIAVDGYTGVLISDVLWDSNSCTFTDLLDNQLFPGLKANDKFTYTSAPLLYTYSLPEGCILKKLTLQNLLTKEKTVITPSEKTELEKKPFSTFSIHPWNI